MCIQRMYTKTDSGLDTAPCYSYVYNHTQGVLESRLVSIHDHTLSAIHGEYCAGSDVNTDADL